MSTDGFDLVKPRMIHEKFSEKIIGSAMAVLNALKPGLDEKLYENALVIELNKAAIKFHSKDNFPSIMKAN